MQLYDLMESENWEKFYESVNSINANPKVFEGLDKYELAEISFCLWILLGDMGIYPGFDESFYPNLEEALYSAYLCYQKKFADDNDFICLMGYMIRKFPENFPKLGSLISVEEFGYELMAEAYQNEPNNPFIYLLNFRNSKGIGDQESILRARSYAITKFKDCKGLTQYFRDIFKTS